MTLAKRLKEARIKAGLTQEALAIVSKTSQQYIDNIESERVNNPRKLSNIARALDVSSSWLLFGQEEGLTHSLSIKISEWDNLHKAVVIGKNFPENYFALKIDVDDESMVNNVSPSPTFPPGTILIVDPTIKEYRNKLVIARQKDKPNSRPIFRRFGTDYIQEWLAPLNRNFTAFQLYPAKDFDILGVVVASMNLDL